jgi:NAD(P)-dependent dehydrogenase (short-subunit alcohol dehydrogenase family)
LNLDCKNAKKHALITGAAGGIGKAVVEIFVNHGYSVIGLDCAPSSTDYLGQKYLQLDLQRLLDDIPFKVKTLNSIKQHLNGDGLSVLVNNAAVQVLGGVATLTLVDWQRTLNINLLAPFALTQSLLPELESAQGCVINISSIHARLTKANFVAYATSKAALSGMTRAMAVDLGGRVRINAIEPAAIATDMLNAGFEGKPERLAELRNCHPQGRIGTPQEVAVLALSMASGDLRFLHGSCVGLDGGISGRLFDPVYFGFESWLA